MARSALFLALWCALLLGSIAPGRVLAQTEDEPIDLTPLVRATGNPDPDFAAAAAAAAAADAADAETPTAVKVVQASSSSAKDAVIAALHDLGTDSATIDTIAAALPSDSATFRDLLTPTHVGAAASPKNAAQAAAAFNGVLDDAFKNATQELMDTILPTGAALRQSAPEAAGGAAAEGELRAPFSGSFPGIVAGFGVPLDPAALASPFSAGTGLPPVAQANEADFKQFSNQLLGDISRRQSAMSDNMRFQIQARERGRAQTVLANACAQYALSEFLRGFAGLISGVANPYSAIFTILSNFAGISYTGLSPQGNSYLSAYCCDLVRQAGINFAAGNGTIRAGAASLDLAGLLGAIPGVPAAATNTVRNVTDVIGTVADAVNSATGNATCNFLDWLAYALQGNPQLLQTFNRLASAVLRLQTRMTSAALAGATRASTAASNILGTLGGGGLGGAGGGPGLGGGGVGPGNIALGGLMNGINALLGR